MSDIIKCRAKVAQHCLDGKPAAEQFGEDLPLTADGTYRMGTIICDPCYAKVTLASPTGRDLLHELDETVNYRDHQASRVRN